MFWLWNGKKSPILHLCRGNWIKCFVFDKWMNLLRGCVRIMAVWKVILSMLVHKLAQATRTSTGTSFTKRCSIEVHCTSLGLLQNEFRHLRHSLELYVYMSCCVSSIFSVWKWWWLQSVAVIFRFEPTFVKWSGRISVTDCVSLQSYFFKIALVNHLHSWYVGILL